MNRIVPIIMGSKSDYDFATSIGQELENWKIPKDYKVLSGHKTPHELLEYITYIDDRYEHVVYETVAGRSNALSGVVAANTYNPVIACPPLDKDSLQIDIWSSLRMPSDVPVLTIIDPKNAALAAARIMGLYDPELERELRKYNEDVRKNITKAKLP
jgi:5-(carboxyamino)imidazole ribonucleotide mutase